MAGEEYHVQEDDPASTPTPTPERQNPKGSANFLSLLFFFWMEKVLRLGSKKTLVSDDLFPLLPEDQSKKLVEKLSGKWAEERGRSGLVGRSPRLWRAFLRFVPIRSYATLVVLRLSVSGSYVILPLLTWYFLRSLSQASDHMTASLYIVALGVAALVRALVISHANYFCDLWGMRLKVAAIGLVYRKLLVVTRFGLGAFCGGNTVNMVSNDAARLEKAALAIGWLFSAPLEIGASVCLLWLLIGWQALFGAVLFLVLIVYVTLMGRASARLQARAAANTDRRLALINESICGIQTVKISAWEDIFRDRIKRLRK